MTNIQFAMLILACLIGGPLAAYAFALGFAEGLLIYLTKGIRLLLKSGDMTAAQPMLNSLSEMHIRPMVDAAVAQAIDSVLAHATQQPTRAEPDNVTFTEVPGLYIGDITVPAGTQRFSVSRSVELGMIGRAPALAVSELAGLKYDGRTAPRIVIDSVTIDGVEIQQSVSTMVLLYGALVMALPPQCVYAGEIVISGCVVSENPVDALVSITSITEHPDDGRSSSGSETFDFRDDTSSTTSASKKETYIGKQYCGVGDTSFRLESESEFIHLKKTAKLIATVVRRGPRDGRLMQIRITQLNIGIADIVGYTNAGYMSPVEDPFVTAEGLEVYEFELSIPENLLFGPISLGVQCSSTADSTINFSLVQA